MNMGIDMKVNLKMAYIRAWEYAIINLGKILMENGKQVKNISEFTVIVMVAFIMDNSKIIYAKDTERTFILMEMYMRVNGEEDISKEEAYINFLMDKDIKVFGRKV